MWGMFFSNVDLFQIKNYYNSHVKLTHLSKSTRTTHITHTNCKHKYIFSVQERNKNPFSKWRRKHQVNMIFLQQRANEIKIEHGRKKKPFSYFCGDRLCVCVSEWLCQRVSVHKIQFSEIHILPNSIENPIHIICIRICMFFIGEKRGKNNFKWLTFLWFVSDVRVHTEVKKKK